MTNISPIRARRDAIGLSQEALARKSRCSTSSIRLAEKGWRPSPAMAARIARSLDLDASELFEQMHPGNCGCPVCSPDDERIARIEEERRQWS